jgi:hypothetical protein
MDPGGAGGVCAPQKRDQGVLNGWRGAFKKFELDLTFFVKHFKSNRNLKSDVLAICKNRCLLVATICGTQVTGLLRPPAPSQKFTAGAMPVARLRVSSAIMKFLSLQASQVADRKTIYQGAIKNI